MWTRDYQYKNINALVISGGFGANQELIALDSGDKDVVKLIENKDPVLLDLLADALQNVKVISVLAWADEGYYVEYIMREKYSADLDAYETKITEVLNSRIGRTEQAQKNLLSELEWIREQRARRVRRAEAKTVRQNLQREYDRLFMAIGRRDGFHCVTCKATTNLSIDHKVAVINGGTNDLDNLQLMCRSHNSSKGAR